MFISKQEKKRLLRENEYYREDISRLKTDVGYLSNQISALWDNLLQANLIQPASREYPTRADGPKATYRQGYQDD